MPEAAQLTPDISDGRPARIVVPGDLNSVRQALVQIRLLFSTSGVDDDTLGSMEIVLAEALNNIVEHAYCDCDGLVTVEIGCFAHSLEFLISDKGTPMPDGEVPLGKIRDYPSEPAKLPEGGFGWHLIHDLTENLTYQRKDDRNILGFSVPR